MRWSRILRRPTSRYKIVNSRVRAQRKVASPELFAGMHSRCACITANQECFTWNIPRVAHGATQKREIQSKKASIVANRHRMEWLYSSRLVWLKSTVCRIQGDVRRVDILNRCWIEKQRCSCIVHSTNVLHRHSSPDIENRRRLFSVHAYRKRVIVKNVTMYSCTRIIRQEKGAILFHLMQQIN